MGCSLPFYIPYYFFRAGGLNWGYRVADWNWIQKHNNLSFSHIIMGIAMDARNWWVVRRQDMAMASMPSPLYPTSYTAQVITKQCSQDRMKAGANKVAIACIASAISVLIGLRAIPWARVNLNYATQAHIITLATGAAYFTVADRTILASARKKLL